MPKKSKKGRSSPRAIAGMGEKMDTRRRRGPTQPDRVDRVGAGRGRRPTYILNARPRRR